MTATTERCPGCHGSGIEMSGVTYAGMSEYVGCHECGPECPDDCGCRASDATERPESIAPRHPGATQGLRGPEGATGPTSDVRPSPTARDAVSDAEAAEWAALADAATEGPWHVQGPSVEEDDWAVYGPTRYVRHGSAAWARGEGHPRLCSAPSGADANFIALARTAVPRLLADRERLVGANARMRQVAELRVGTWRDTAARLEAERDRARGTAATLEAENAQLTADLAAMEAEDNREHVRARHWTEVLRVRRELDGIRREMNDVTEIIAEALGYRPSGLPLDGWPHLSTTGDHTPTSLAAEAAGVLAKASRLREGIEALAAEMEADETPPDEERYVLDDYANALLALLAEGGE